MLPLFTTPLAFFGLLSLPALAAIYYLQMRSRVQPVSSLLLWSDARPAPEGGRRVEKLRFPLLFWIELLILALLAFAAAGPHVPVSVSSRPLIVVLDDSFSMQAGGEAAPRNRAMEALKDELRRRPRGSVRYILGGERPQLLGEDANLDRWTCQSPLARLDTATALALQIGGNQAAVLILSDRAPERPPETGRVRWWSFGMPSANGAIVNASRTPGPRGDRILIETANLARESRSVPLSITSGETELKRVEIQLAAGELNRLVLELPENQGPIRATLADDELNFDNAVDLLPNRRRKVVCDSQLTDAKLQAAVKKALDAAGGLPPDTPPLLLFLDAAATAPNRDDLWVVRVHFEKDAEAYSGPFVLDRAHPLADGLSLAGVVWGGGKTPLSGSPIVMVGNIPLLTDVELPNGRHELHLRLRHELSTLTESPAWPVLMWNLIQWRAASLPGLDRANVRVGEEVTWSLDGGANSLQLKRPGLEEAAIPIHSRRAVVRAERPGIHRMKAGNESGEFAANPLSRDESDLLKCETGRWGEEADETALRLEYRDIRWMLVLLAGLAATLHLWIAARSRGAT